MGVVVPCPVRRHYTGRWKCADQAGDDELGCIHCPYLQKALADYVGRYMWVCPWCVDTILGEQLEYYAGPLPCECCGRDSFLLSPVVPNDPL